MGGQDDLSWKNGPVGHPTPAHRHNPDSLSFTNNKNPDDPLQISAFYVNNKLEALARKFPNLNQEQLRKMMYRENGLLRLCRLTRLKEHNHKVESLFKLNKWCMHQKYIRLQTMYLGNLLKGIFRRGVELFFLAEKKQRFLNDIDRQREALDGPLATLGRCWGRQLARATRKLRIFKNIVNNYEYHIQPFQKRSLKNNIIGLLREMDLNSHRNQKFMLRRPTFLKQGLLLLITRNIINARAEEHAETLIGHLKGSTLEAFKVAACFRRLGLIFRNSERGKQATFFRLLTAWDRSQIEDFDNRSQISRFTRNGPNRANYMTQGDMSFENNQHGTGTHRRLSNLPTQVSKHPASHRVVNSFYNQDRPPYARGSLVSRYGEDPMMTSNLMLSEMKRSLWRRDPSLYLPMLLKEKFKKRTGQIFEYMKLLFMLRRLQRPFGGEMTKSVVLLRKKVGNEHKLSFKLLAIIVDRIMCYQIREKKRKVLKLLKNKEVKIYKVLFGKVTPVKPNFGSSVLGDTSMMNRTTYAKSMIASRSFVNFQRPTQGRMNQSYSKHFLII